MENSEKIAPETNWLNEKQVSAMLNIKESTLQNWRWRGVGVTYSRFMRNVRYRESDVIRYLNDHIVNVEAA
ncbi:MAG TPA: DNA-binding protein [Deltaproteobacteria bacterium]|jgi:phage terminase Nu1 subunit (DNA packaging protein)|nr:DNA-binding protein [Candidatus Lambdaproteobacteria bacterium]HIN48535.1 DNA-binding protein [Deltaproteobacteria bacterium]